MQEKLEKVIFLVYVTLQIFLIKQYKYKIHKSMKCKTYKYTNI